MHTAAKTSVVNPPSHIVACASVRLGPGTFRSTLYLLYPGLPPPFEGGGSSRQLWMTESITTSGGREFVPNSGRRNSSSHPLPSAVLSRGGGLASPSSGVTPRRFPFSVRAPRDCSSPSLNYTILRRARSPYFLNYIFPQVFDRWEVPNGSFASSPSTPPLLRNGSAGAQERPRQMSDYWTVRLLRTNRAGNPATRRAPGLGKGRECGTLRLEDSLRASAE